MPKRKRTAESPALAEKSAFDLAKRVTIKDVRALSLAAEQHPELMETPELIVNYRYSAKTERDTENEAVAVVVSFEMTAKTGQDESAATAVSIRLALQLVYECPGLKDFTTSAVDEFGRLNGVYNAWPYWREFVQNAIARMGLPALIVPVFRLSEAKSKSKESADDGTRIAQKRKKQQRSTEGHSVP